MRICFYADGPKSGFANNGGSQTILRSVEALRLLGHQVDTIAEHDSFTWFHHDPSLRSVDGRYDAMVAVSSRDVKKMCQLYHGKADLLFWWVRGKELWQMSEKKLIERAHMVHCITNASHLSDWLSSHGVESQVCFAGLDFDTFHGTSTRYNTHVTVGGLYHKAHKTKRWDIIKRLAREYECCPQYEFRSFGHSKMVDKRNLIGRRGMNYKTLPTFYRSCNIWVAPTELEGFHNVAAEANLCGCLVVCNRMPTNGMGDYATDETAMRFDTYQELFECLKSPQWEKIEKMQAVLNAIGNRNYNMKRFVEILCHQLV